MYYNRILRVWVVDIVDYFLFSAIIGSIIASYLKDYLSEKKAMKRLKNSIIKKSKLVIKSNIPTPNSKEIRIQRIYKFAVGTRGGQFENFNKADYEFSNEIFKLAEEIKALVERLAAFLKERELRGIARIFFKGGRLILQLILTRCNIDINYSLLTDGLSTQVIIMTVTTGGSLGFILSWFSVGASLVAPPLLISVLLVRNVIQQIKSEHDFLKFKQLLTKILEDKELKQTLRAFFVESEVEVPTTIGIEMQPWGLSNHESIPDFNFDSKQTFDEFIKSKMEDELGLVENPTQEQIKKIINNRKSRKQGKTVYFKDFIKEVAENPNEIIDAEIVNKTTSIRLKNEEL